MRYSKSARTLKSIVYGVPLVLSASCFVNSASDTSQFSDEIDENQTVAIGQKISRSLSSAVTLQSKTSQQIDKITLQNIRNIQDMDIFGSELMTKSELAKFRIDLKKVKTQDQLEQYLAAHRARMNERATERGVVLE